MWGVRDDCLQRVKLDGLHSIFDSEREPEFDALYKGKLGPAIYSHRVWSTRMNGCPYNIISGRVSGALREANIHLG